MSGSSRILAGAVLAKVLTDAFAGNSRIIMDEDTKPEEKFFKVAPDCLPVTRAQKLAAVGLSVNSSSQAKATRYGYGEKPPSNNFDPQSRECQRRQRQLQRQKEKAARKALASTSLTSE